VPGREKPLYGLLWRSEATRTGDCPAYLAFRASHAGDYGTFGRKGAHLTLPGVSSQESVSGLELARSAPIGILQQLRELA